MRPSKLRLPDNTAATVSWPSSMALDTGSGRGPELPMQVVQPYPTIWNPRASRAGCTPALAKYSRTTFEPGASDVFTHGFDVSPRATAFCASRPAASITLGLAVLVHEVMAAITTWPSRSSNVWPRHSHGMPPPGFNGPSPSMVAMAAGFGCTEAAVCAFCAWSDAAKLVLTSLSEMRSCGR